LRDPETITYFLQINTEVYRNVFRCLPDDAVTKLEHFPEFQAKRNLNAYDEEIQKIQGHAVEFPKEFLKEQTLKLKVFDMENLLPEELFT